jgi:hypothetical protein
MNIFILSEDPIEAAQMQCNKHVVKMIVESAQMLSTSHRILDGVEYIDSSSNRKIKRYKHDNFESELYHACHINHPCTIWTRNSSSNYQWLFEHFIALCKEYTLRYNKIHLTQIKLNDILKYTPKNIKSDNLTKFALAMPKEYMQTNTVQSYRDYYKSKQNKFKMEWTNRTIPEWIN